MTLEELEELLHELYHQGTNVGKAEKEQNWDMVAHASFEAKHVRMRIKAEFKRLHRIIKTAGVT